MFKGYSPLKNKKYLLISILLSLIFVIALTSFVVYPYIQNSKNANSNNQQNSDKEINSFNSLIKPQLVEKIQVELRSAEQAQKKLQKRVFSEKEVLIQFHPNKVSTFKPSDYGIEQITKVDDDIALYKIINEESLSKTISNISQSSAVKISEPNYIGSFMNETIKTYINSEYNFSFSYPSNFSSCCGIAGPTSQNAKNLVTFGNPDKSQLKQGVGSGNLPDGISVYIVSNVSNFSTFIENEKKVLKQNASAFGSTIPNASIRNTTVDNLAAVELYRYSWDEINRIYIQKGNNVFVLAYLNNSPSFASIKSSFKFSIPSSIRPLTNDPLVQYQWNLESPDTTADLNIREAWQLEGEYEPIIAVVDSGLMLDHEDMKESLWVNTKEIPGNKIDDDKNGYIDDVNGFNFSNPDQPVTGFQPHGTWVASVIAAEPKNGKGIAGICSKCKIMPLTVHIEMILNQQENDVIVSKILQAFNYAQKNGAKVINNSYTIGYYSQILQNKINELYSKNIVVVAAAGNSGKDLSTPNEFDPNRKTYPAMMNNVIAVGALNRDGTKSAGSSYGDAVDISAPASLVPMANFYQGNPVTKIPPQTIYNSDAYATETSSGGTSIATPHVSGVIGLILTRKPWLSSKEIEDIIKKSATPHIQTQYKLGVGMLNANEAMKLVIEN